MCKDLNKKQKQFIPELLSLHKVTHQVEIKIQKLKLKFPFKTKEHIYFCHQCTYSSKSCSTFQRHLRTIHKNYSVLHQCLYDKCDFKTDTLKKFKVHLIVVHNELDHECPICKKRFAFLNILNQHVFHKHSEGKKLACSWLNCKFKCRFPGDLKIHVRTHTGEKPYECTVCKIKFNQKCNLNTHTKVYHLNQPREKKFQCGLCSRSFYAPSSLEIHVRSHTGEKPFKCTLCSYSAASSGLLKGHSLTHRGQKPFSCRICPYKCAKQVYLTRHLRIHTGEKPFKCKFCNYSSTEGGPLKTHIRTHTGERPYSCSQCKRCFINSSNYKNHKCHAKVKTPFII